MQVDIEKIIPVTEARDKFNKVVDEVEGSDEIYVFTKNGKPASVMVGVNHLEKLTGETHGDIEAKIAETPGADPIPAPVVPTAEADDPFVTTPTETPVNEPAVAPDNTPATPEPTLPAKPTPSVPDGTPGPVPIEPEPSVPANDPMASSAPASDATPANNTPSPDPFATPDSNNE